LENALFATPQGVTPGSSHDIVALGEAGGAPSGLPSKANDERKEMERGVGRRAARAVSCIKYDK